MSVKYVNGLLSAQSSRILSSEKLKNLASLEQTEFIKQLHELNYGPGFSKVNTIEEIINYETESINNLLKTYNELDHLRIVVFYDYFLSSIQSLYKHKVFNLSLNEVSNQLVDLKQLKDAILSGLTSQLVDFYRGLIELININIKNVDALDDLSNVVVKVSYEYLYDYLGKNKEKGLTDFLEYKIDLLNLNYAAQMNNYDEFNNRVLIERGDLYKVIIKSKDFTDLLNNQMQNYNVIFQRDLIKLLKENSLYEMPNITNEFLTEKIRNFKYDLTSSNHILYFVLSSLEQFKIFKEIYFGVYDGK